MTTLLLAGTTGLVGSAVREQALADPRVSEVVAISRQPLPPTPGLHNSVVDFDALTGDEPWWAADAVICTLGTSRANADSKAAFHHANYKLPLMIARHSRAAGTLTYVLASTAGASTHSPLPHCRVKGELEDALRECHFPSLAMVRPALISGHRRKNRRLERFATRTATRMERVLPQRWRVHPVARVAAMLLESALTNRPGTRVIEADQIRDWPGSPFL